MADYWGHGYSKASWYVLSEVDVVTASLTNVPGSIENGQFTYLP
jgi:hypothetical protein